jgi:predicted HTH domain antitoxin
MSEIMLSVPDEALSAMKMTPEQFGGELRLAGAVKLYEIGRLSSGAAAQVAGIPRTVFLTKLADFGGRHFSDDGGGFPSGDAAWLTLSAIETSATSPLLVTTGPKARTSWR